jgi:hypothetical protein
MHVATDIEPHTAIVLNIITGIVVHKVVGDGGVAGTEVHAMIEIGIRATVVNLIIGHDPVRPCHEKATVAAILDL